MRRSRQPTMKKAVPMHRDASGLHLTRIFGVGSNKRGIPKGFWLKAQGCDPAQRESYPGTTGSEVRTTLKGLRSLADGGEANRAQPRWGCGNFADVFPG